MSMRVEDPTQGRGEPRIGGALVITDAVLTDLLRVAAQPGEPAERAEQVARLLAGPGRTVAVRWWEQGRLRTLAAAGPAVASVTMPEPELLTATLLEGEAVERPDLRLESGDLADEPWCGLAESAGQRAVLVLPLAGPAGVEGVLALFDQAAEAFDTLATERRALLAELVWQAVRPAAAVEPAAAAEPAPRSAPAEDYRDVLVALHLDRDPDDVCRRAVAHLRGLLGAESVMVARWDPTQQGFDCHLTVERVLIVGGESAVLERVQNLRQPLEFGLDSNAGDRVAERLRGSGAVAALVQPLLFQGDFYGALVVGYGPPGVIRPEVHPLLEQVAFHLALALRDAALQEAQELSLSKLRQAQDDATQLAKFRALAQMAGGVAHEFNNALGGILARTQMLQRQTQDRRILKGLTTISEIGWRAAETVRRLQEFTRERSEEDFERLAAEALWQRLSEAVRQQVAAYSRTSGARYHIELELDHLRGELLVCVDELCEAVGNVITNALEATPGGGVVTLHGNSTGGDLCLTVVDRGRGMSVEELQSCFDPFYSTKAETGVGLGLSVTYGIIARHKGEIEIDSTPGQGTTVSITLPLLAEEALKISSTPHVLVIDDEEALCDVLSELFQSAGYTVDTCAGGREGIEKYSTCHYDLVCTDLRTEDLSGWEVIRAVKDGGRGTPVMLLTGFREQLRQDQIEESGVDLVLGKPFTLQQVLQASSKLLAAKEA